MKIYVKYLNKIYIIYKICYIYNMITVPEIIGSLIRESPFLEEGLARGIINVSALARMILPEVQHAAMKDIKEGAVIMALNRLSRKIQNQSRKERSIFTAAPDMMIRSNLFEITLINSQNLAEKRRILLDQIGTGGAHFLTFTQGVFETTIIASSKLKDKVEKVFLGETVVSLIEKLSALTVQLPSGTANAPGAYNYLLRELAWERINIVEVVSTLNEFTIILRNEDIDKAFFILKRLF